MSFSNSVADHRGLLKARAQQEREEEALRHQEREPHTQPIFGAPIKRVNSDASYINRILGPYDTLFKSDAPSNAHPQGGRPYPDKLSSSRRTEKQNGEHRTHSRDRSSGHHQAANNPALQSKSGELKQQYTDKHGGRADGAHSKKGHRNLEANAQSKHDKERHRTKSSQRPVDQASSKHHSQHSRSLSAGVTIPPSHHVKESSSKPHSNTHVSPVKPAVSTAKADSSLSAATTKADSTTSSVVTSSSTGSQKSIPTPTNSQSHENSTESRFRSPLHSPEKHKLPKSSLTSTATSHQTKTSVKPPNGILPTLNGVVKSDNETKKKKVPTATLR